MEAMEAMETIDAVGQEAFAAPDETAVWEHEADGGEPGGLTARVEADETRALVALSGTGGGTPDATELTEKALAKAVEQRPRVLVLDLSRLSYLSTVTLGQMLVAHASVARYGGRVRIAAPHPRVYEVLRITKLYRILPVYPTVPGALGAEA